MPVINEPQLKSPAQRVGEGAIIGIGMTLMGAFVILLTLAVWYFASRYFYSHLFIPQYYEQTVTMLINLFILAIAAFLVMYVWAIYNLNFYGKKHRRTAVPRVQLGDIAPYYSIDERQVVLAQGFKSAYIDTVEDKFVLCSYEGSCFKTDDPGWKKGKTPTAGAQLLIML